MPRKKKDQPQKIFYIVEWGDGAGPHTERYVAEAGALKAFAELRVAGCAPILFRAVELPVELIAQVKGA